MAAAGIGTRTLRGVVWVYGSYVGGRLVALASTAILARLLLPEQFGVVAAALTFMALLDALGSLGLAQALIVVDESEVLEKAETAFVATVALGLGLSTVIAVLSPWVATFFHEPALRTVVPALGCNFFLRSLGSVHYELARKRLQFRSRTIAEFADVVVRGVVGVSLALAGAGAWSLVAGYLTGTLALVVAIWWLVPWRPRLRPRFDNLRSLLAFGTRLSAVDLIAAAISNVDYLFVGRLLGTTALGLYTLGFQLPSLIIVNIAVVAGQVLFPAFAAVDRADLGRAFLTSLRYTLMVGLPLTAGLGVLGRPFVLAAFGEHWTRSIIPMQILTVYAAALTVGFPAGTAYKATGRAGILVRLALGRAALAVGSIWLFVDQGINAVAACQAGTALTFAVLEIGLASRLLAVGLPAILREVWPPAVAALSTAAVLVVVERTISAPWPALVVGAVAGGVTYGCVLWLVARDAIRHVRHTMFPGSPSVRTDVPV